MVSSTRAACWPAIPFRLVVVTMAVLGMAFCYMGRQNLSLAIIAMTKSTKTIYIQNDDELTSNATSSPINSTNISILNEAPAINVNQQQTNDISLQQTYGPKYDWKGTRVLGAFFWSYVIFQTPCGRLGERIGPQWVLLASGLGTAVLNAISPWAASLEATGDWAFFVVRLMLGILQGGTFPASYSIISNWLPPKERQVGLTLLNFSLYLGSIFAMEETAFFTSRQQFGWPFAFYFPALVFFIWSLIWILVGKAKPADHKCVRQIELDYITKSNDYQEVTVRSARGKSTDELDWFKLLRSRQIWALIIAFISITWPSTIIMQILPTYLFNILAIGTTENARINEYTYLLHMILVLIAGMLSTYVTSTRYLANVKRIFIRKTFQSIAVWGQAICFLMIPQLGTQKGPILAMIYLNTSIAAFHNAGITQLPAEICPEFGGTLFALGNSAGFCCGFLMPIVFDSIVTDKTDIAQWDTFFYVGSGIIFTGNLIFVLFGNNEYENFSKKTREDDSLLLPELEEKTLTTKISLDINKNLEIKEESEKLLSPK